VNDDPFAADDAATPLTPDERRDLIPSYVTLRRELNELEALNVIAGEHWASSRKRDALDEGFLRNLHRQMFGDVWRWAGDYRTTERNLGVAPLMIAVEMRQALDDARYWVTNNTWGPDALAARVHHRLVFIHPFPNGNGRWARLTADILLVQLGGARFSWGRASLVDASATRTAYVNSLRAADQGDFGALLAFVRS